MRQNVAGRQSGRVTEHIKTHTHTHMRTVCLAGPAAATQKYPCGCRPDAPTYRMPRWSHTRKEPERGEESKGAECGVGGEVGAQKSLKKKKEVRRRKRSAVKGGTSREREGR